MSKILIKKKWNYTDLASNYDVRADYSEKLIKKILKRFNCIKNYSVADIGAGTGKLTKVLCKYDLVVNAIEPNKKMTFYGKKNTMKFSNINWSYGTGENTTLKDNSIHSVFFGSSFNTVNYKKTFKEIKRILIKNGYFCCLWNHRFLENKHQKNIEKIIRDHIPNYNYGDRRYDYKKLLNEQKNFFKINKLTQRFNVKIKKKDFIKAWKSHGTLRNNCKNSKQFNQIVKNINNYTSKIKGKVIIVPYDTVAYLARLK